MTRCLLTFLLFYHRMHLVMNENQEALAPHTYPIWIKLSGIACIIFLCICATDIPYHLELNQDVKSAYAALQNGDSYDAYVQYARLSERFPKSKRFKIRTAESLFISPLEEDHYLALNRLESISLEKDEWNDLLKYMPEEYITAFVDVKKRR
jgi:hypothetical protein